MHVERRNSDLEVTRCNSVFRIPDIKNTKGVNPAHSQCCITSTKGNLCYSKAKQHGLPRVLQTVQQIEALITLMHQKDRSFKTEDVIKRDEKR